MRVLAPVLAAAALAGCGGDSSPNPAEDQSAVIRAWADAVRTGDYKEANELFALPAAISNGQPTLKLTTRAQIDVFNRSLPCGAILLDTQKSAGGRLLATFRLTDGANGRSCGNGKGNKARVTFRIRDGHIEEWLRERTGPPPGSIES